MAKDKQCSATQQPPTVSVVISTVDRDDALDACLAACSAFEYPNYEVIVVNNGAGERPREIAQRWGARYLVETRPGISAARNAAARACNSDVITFLDDDAIPEPDLLNHIVSDFADPKVMVVTARLVPKHDAGTERKTLDQADPAWFELSNFGRFGAGASFSLRRSFFGPTPFDERLGYGEGSQVRGAEDLYAIYSVVKAGYTVVYNPRALVAHPHPEDPAVTQRWMKGCYESRAGYLLFLFFEERKYWRQLFKYMARKMFGRTRDDDAPPPHVLSRRERLQARTQGVFTYVKMRLSARWRGLRRPAKRNSTLPAEKIV
jgi:cellulose synthase/poly-beta-1,6-N-acetylglucosamine synthase-like glycosyltransferase